MTTLPKLLTDPKLRKPKKYRKKGEGHFGKGGTIDAHEGTSLLVYCKRCKHKTPPDKYINITCAITSMKCEVVIPVCKKWQFREEIPFNEQPIFVANDESTIDE